MPGRQSVAFGMLRSKPKPDPPGYVDQVIPEESQQSLKDGAALNVASTSTGHSKSGSKQPSKKSKMSGFGSMLTSAKNRVLAAKQVVEQFESHEESNGDEDDVNLSMQQTTDDFANTRMSKEDSWENVLQQRPDGDLEEVVDALTALKSMGIKSANDVEGMIFGIQQMLRDRGLKKRSGNDGQYDKVNRLRQKAAKQYMEPKSLKDALEGGEILLLRTRWLGDCSTREGQVLKRRQELPVTAHWSHVETLFEAAPPDRCAPNFVAVSCGWLTESHPDPQGEQLCVLSQALKACNPDGAVFWDWGSLFQHPRDNYEEEAFRNGLKHIHLWYISQLVWKVLLTALPTGYEDTRSFQDRGWTTFERQVSGLITDSDMVLDLGLLNGETPANSDHLKRVCMTKREAPMSPDSFERFLKTKQFMVEADAGFVEKLYSKIFNDVLAGVDRLFFSGQQWGLTEINQFAEAVRSIPQPPPLRLQELWLARNCIGDKGVEVLSQLLSQGNMPALVCLLLDENNITINGARMLMYALDAGRSSLRTLGLSGNNFSAEEVGTVQAGLQKRGILKLAI